MAQTLIFRLNGSELSDHIGNKAKNLKTLKDIRKIKLPKTWAIPWDVYQRYRNKDEGVLDELETALKYQLDPSKVYAVRSSSNIEDSSFHSFAGLFKTLLNVQGYDNLINAIIEVWDAANSEIVTNYLDNLALNPEEINMGVIVQEMVPAKYSGVLFSNNPMTGTSETVIEGVPGEGTALVQDGVTPERWVARSGSWVAKPDHSQMPAQVAKNVLDEFQKIRKKIKIPIDLEWVYDGHDVYWVQMREITSLKDLNIYSNRMAKDMMPGMVHPLIYSINVSLISSVWLGILEEIVGTLTIKAEDLVKSFFYRSYFNMGAIGKVFTQIGLPSEGLEMMMGIVPNQEGRPAFTPNIKMLPLFPKLIRFAVDKWNFERRIQSDYPEFLNEIEHFSPNPDKNTAIEDQVKEINHLREVLKRIVYLNIITPLLVSMYSRMLEQQLKKLGFSLLEFDLLEDMEGLDEYNPNIAMAELKTRYDSLVQEYQLNRENKDSALSLEDIKGTHFENDLEQFIENFGHMSDNSNNFMAVPFRESPESILKMIHDFQDIKLGKDGRIGFDDLRLKGTRKLFTRVAYQRARKFTLYRDKISKQYVYGYGLFRPYFFRTADWMVDAGWINAREDIFYLTWDEIQELIKENNGSDLAEIIDERKAEMEEYKDIILPDVIYGEDPPPVFSGNHKRLHGTPTSQGYYSGQVKVIKGLADFEKVQMGDVIVIPYSDVGWTPLFTRAGAVIAESGGLLSHSSIIAREYQIPAVVSVPNCMGLEDCRHVSVNGFTGEIILLDEEQELEEGD